MRSQNVSRYCNFLSLLPLSLSPAPRLPSQYSLSFRLFLCSFQLPSRMLLVLALVLFVAHTHSSHDVCTACCRKIYELNSCCCHIVASPCVSVLHVPSLAMVFREVQIEPVRKMRGSPRSQVSDAKERVGFNGVQVSRGARQEGPKALISLRIPKLTQPTISAQSPLGEQERA
jgi:hypothetical protein